MQGYMGIGVSAGCCMQHCAADTGLDRTRNHTYTNNALVITLATASIGSDQNSIYSPCLVCLSSLLCKKQCFGAKIQWALSCDSALIGTLPLWCVPAFPDLSLERQFSLVSLSMIGLIASSIRTRSHDFLDNI